MLLLRVVFNYIDWPKSKYLYLQFINERGNFHWHQTFRLFIAFCFWSSIFHFLWTGLYFKFLNATQVLSILPPQTSICHNMRKDTHLKKEINEDHVNKLQYQKTKSNSKFQISTFYCFKNQGIRYINIFTIRLVTNNLKRRKT